MGKLKKQTFYVCLYNFKGEGKKEKPGTFSGSAYPAGSTGCWEALGETGQERDLCENGVEHFQQV